MLGKFFKIIGFFFLCFVILCIPVNNKPIFEYLFKASKPAGNIIKETALKGFDQTKNVGKKFFANSIPKTSQNKNIDTITEKRSAPKKSINNVEVESDQFLETEKNELESTINNFKE